jgi:hypothetical protein
VRSRHLDTEGQPIDRRIRGGDPRATHEPLDLPIDGQAPRTPAGPSTGRFGIVWRAAIPGIEPWRLDSSHTIVMGGEVFVSPPTDIHVFDLATGATLRSVATPHVSLLAARDALVEWTVQEEVGLDPRTLRPTWHAQPFERLTAVQHGAWLAIQGDIACAAPSGRALSGRDVPRYTREATMPRPTAANVPSAMLRRSVL